MTLFYTILEFVKAIPYTIRYVFSKQPMAWNFIKRFFLQEIIKKHNLDYFVETWTFYWETTQYISRFVNKVVTIEIYQPLYERAKKKFHNNRKIDIIYADSSDALKNIKFKKDVLFFLDWHYSGDWTWKGQKECPLFEELESIKSLWIQNQVIVIDDFRLFWVDSNYPTMTEIESKLKSINKKYTIQVIHDMLYCYIQNNDSN